MPIPTSMAEVPRSLLREEVFTRLRDAITDGSLAPGEQLRDLELAAQLGVSRTPVREALLRLADVGLVVARPGASTIVSPLELQAVTDARDVVAAMHETAVRVAVHRLTSSDLDEMRAANERFAAAIRQGDLEAALAADDELHAVPVRVSGNRAVAAVLDQYSPVLRRAEKLRFSTLTGRGSIARHTSLIDLCASGDGEAAATNAFDTWHTLPTGDPAAPDPSVNED